MSQDPDWPLRAAAFKALRERVARYGEVLPWERIDEGFVHGGEVVKFANRARGIFRPRQMRGAALSIKTTVPRQGREARYDDLSSDEGFHYRFQGSDPEARDNRQLTLARELDAPLIYLYGVAPGLYRPLWPVYVTEVDAAALTCTVVTAEPGAAVREPGRHAADGRLVALERRYATVQVKKRLHQVAFRHHVLEAYDTRCAVCRFPRPELLDAAHILPDRDVRGRPEVPNGLALCRLHHGAFDTNLMGVRPDGIIEIAPRLFKERDGPTLEHGLKGFDGRALHAPGDTRLRPRREYLEERYEQFRQAG